MNISFDITQEFDGISIKSFLRHQGISLHLWRRLKHNGVTLVNGTPVIAAITKLKAGNRLICRLTESSPIEPIKIELDIRYEDEFLLIVNKPTPLLVHPVTHKKPEATLANGVTYYYQKTNQDLIFHPMHRLDRNTSGLVLIAKEPHMQSQLTSNSGSKFHRKYIGIINGIISPCDGVIDSPIAKKPGSIIEQQVDIENGKFAQTEYKTLFTFDDKSLLELSPVTGRTHQIRVHLASIGHPLLGDDLYGQKSNIISRQALHAYKIILIHPVTKQSLSITAPLPDDMKNILANLPLSVKTILPL